ncbi:MAG TPA: hypothetical protein VEN78_31485, partial [Bradyrhizobium sp.]|nr:hypothetical protein [Bradyrhizobium sp.]
MEKKMVSAIRARTFGFLLFLFCLYFPGSHLHAQQNGVFFTLFPYDGNNAPLDRSKIVFGSTPEEVCAQRTEAEIIGA